MNTHNKTSAAKNQQQSIQHQSEQMAADDQTQTQHVYALQVIDDQSQMDDGDSTNEGDITEYLTHANIITKDDDGTTSESESQLYMYDVDVLDAIKGQSEKRKFLTTKGGQLHEIAIADSDPTDLLTFEDDELE